MRFRSGGSCRWGESGSSAVLRGGFFDSSVCFRGVSLQPSLGDFRRMRCRSGGFLLSERERVAGSVAGGLSYSGRRRSAIRRSVRRPARVYPFLFAESVALSVDRRFPVVELRTGDALALCEARKRRRRRVLSRNRPRLFCAMAGLAPCLFSVRDRLVRTCPPERSGRRSRMPRHLSFTSFAGRLDGETVERPAGSARIASSHDGAGPERAMDGYILQRTEHVRIRNFKRPLAGICGHKLPIRLGFYWAGPLRRKGAAYGKAGNIGNSKAGTIRHIIGGETKIGRPLMWPATLIFVATEITACTRLCTGSASACRLPGRA